MMTEVLCEDQVDEFRCTGALIVRNAIDRADLQSIHERIVAWLDSAPKDTDAIARYTRRTFAEELAEDADILSVLYESILLEIVERLVQPFALQPVARAQVQIRLPEADGGADQPEKPVHVDGLWCGHLPDGALNSFSVLVGVAVTQVTESAGPLRFIPGGHRLVSEWISAHGEAPPDDGSECPAPIRTQPEREFVASPGDAIFLHYLCPHAAGTNTTSDPRVMLYFRIKVQGHDGRRLLADPWIDFPSLRDTSGQGSTRY